MEEKDVPMIPQHEAENMLMHMSWSNRNMLIAIIAFCITIIVCVFIFVNGYTSRTKDWLNTYNNLQRNTAVTEGANDVQQQPPP